MKTFIFFGLLLFAIIILSPAFAQAITTCAPSTSPPPRVTGLATTPNLEGKFYTSSAGKCIVDEKVVFVPFKIPTYDDLKSIYYTQSKALKSTITTLPGAIADKTVYFVNGDLNISSSPTGGGTAIVFVEGNLTFTTPATEFIYGSANSGLVFVVKGNVNIHQSFIRIDGVIISSGIICTAFDGITCPASNITTSQLVINGSLISLDPLKTIKFRRDLGAANLTTPAEKINHQVKYLVILRDIFSETLQKWSEIVGDITLPSPPPSPPPTPIPTPTPTPVPTVTTQAASSITASSATLNSSINPNGIATSGWYRYGTSNTGNCATLASATTAVALGSGTTAVSNPQTVSGLSSSTAYYFCAVAQSSAGTSFGSILSFTTQAACTNGYRDFDKDGYGFGAFGCYLASASYNIVSNSSDCYDSNADAKPGQTSYFTTNRGDGSFDYDCSGSITYGPILGNPPVSRLTGVISCGGLFCTEPLTPSMCGVNQGYSIAPDFTCFTCSPQTRSTLSTTATLSCR